MFYMTIEGNLPQTAIPVPVSGTPAPQYTNYSAGSQSSRAGDAALMAKKFPFQGPTKAQLCGFSLGKSGRRAGPEPRAGMAKFRENLGQRAGAIPWI